MTVGTDGAPVVRPEADQGLAHRLWGAPLAAHVAVLAVALVAGLFLIGPRVAYSSDEGVTVAQARLLVQHGTWYYHPPLASIDPDDLARPYVRGDLGTKGLAPYAKHPAYPVLLAGALGLADPLGAWLLTMAGTVGAAAMAALLARRLGAGLARPTLWVVGIGSPLFFDAYFITAHTLAAFAAGGGVLVLLHALDDGRSGPRRAVGLLAAGGLVTLAAMLRTEALFLGVALGAAVVGLAVLGRLSRRLAAVAAIVLAGASAAAWLADRVLSRWIIGQPLGNLAEPGPSSWIAGRWQSFDSTWLQANYTGERIGALTLALAAALLVAAALSLRLGRPRRDVAAVLTALAVLCLVGRFALGSPGTIPGLALAFPVGVVGLWSMGRRSVEGITAPLLTGASALVAVAVLATQYPRGGGIEWGGRYFAVILPLAVPVLVQALAEAIRHRPPDRLVRWSPLLAVGLCLFPALIAVQALHSAHQATAVTLDAMQSAAAEAGVAPGQDRPIVLSRNRLLPQIAYTDFDDYEWVVPDDLEPFGDRLAGIGVDRVVLVSPDAAADLEHLPGWHAVGEPDPGLPLDVVVIERDGPTH